MIENTPSLIAAIRDRFAHVDRCPFEGPRIYFENGGGALTLTARAPADTACPAQRWRSIQRPWWRSRASQAAASANGATTASASPATR